MLKAERSFYPIAFPQKAPVFFCILFSTFISCFGGKIEPTVILASLEGEVHSFSLEDEFKVSLDSSSIGKTFSQKSVLTTGKDGKAGLLFSNGALITIKPGSRFYLRKYNQKIVSNAKITNPSKMEEEPSNSELFAHLDFGELIVKAPKLNKGSMMVLSSPLGTAGIRGTMFQLMAVRNPLTGDISGGINLISGDIDFTDTSGNAVTLVSGQSIVAATSKLGENIGAQSGGLVDLTSTFGPGLSGTRMPPAMDSLFPSASTESSEESSADDSSSSAFESGGLLAGGASGGGWEMIHEIASDVFFEIEGAESSSSSITFESMLVAVSLDTPTPELAAPGESAILSGGSDSPLTPDPFQGAHPFMNLKGDDYLTIELTDKDFGDIDPWIDATDFLGNDLSSIVSLENPPDLQKTDTYTLEYKVTDLRGLTTGINRTVEVVETKPKIELTPGKYGSIQENGEQIFPFLVQKKYANYPTPDDGPFNVIWELDPPLNSTLENSPYPKFSLKYYEQSLDDFTYQEKVVTDLPYPTDSLSVPLIVLSTEGGKTEFRLEKGSVDYSKITAPGEPDSDVTFTFNDYDYRYSDSRTNLSLADVEQTVVQKIRIIDNQPPILSVLSGFDQSDPHQVEGVLDTTFVDPGILILDNYYSQQEIEQNLGYQTGAIESAFGNVDMNVAGIYEVIYQGIKDPSGNDALPISRWVEVFDNTSPELSIYGADPLFVDVNNTNSLFRDPGAVAYDNLDGTIDWETGKITVSMQSFDENGSAVSTNSTIDEIVAVAKTQASLNKTFQMIYSYIDAAGNEGTTTRQIVLINSPFDTPFIIDSSPSDNPLIVDVLVISDPTTGLRRDPNTNKFEPGVTAYKDFGGNLEPKNLTSEVSENEYIGGVLGAINDTIVNYSLKQDAFVDPQGNPDESYRSIIKYVVQDDFGNEAIYSREIRVVDRDGPLITLKNGSEGGKHFSYLQAGIPFVDPGHVASDNYDENVTVTSKLVQVDTGQELSFDLVSSIGFTDIGSYEIRYSAEDQNGNLASENSQSDMVRTIEVIDTYKPQVALFTHDFVRGTSTSLNSVNDPTELENTSIVDLENPIPSSISSSLSSFTGWTGSDFDPDVALTLLTESDFYVFAEQDEILVDGHPNSVVEATDSNGRYRYRMSGFYFKDKNTNAVMFEDPGIYARNDSNVPLSFSSTITPVTKANDPNTVLSYKINYYVSQQDNSGANQIIAARRVFIIDQEKPLITLDPPTDGTNSFVIIEANRQPTSTDRYTDLHGDAAKLFYSNVSPPNDVVTGKYLSLSAIDALDGVLTDAIVRTIKDDNGSSVEISSNSDQNAVAANVYSQIDATTLDRKFTIEYYVNDIPIDSSIPPNTSDVVVRHLIVKDTKPPVIDVTELNSTFMIDFLSTSDPDINDGKSVATYLLTGLTATDANDFDQELGRAGVTNSNALPTTTDPDSTNWVLVTDGNGAVSSATYNSKWKLEFTPAFSPGAIYPETRGANSGYEVKITATDQSGNISGEVLRYLQVGDFTPPTLTLIGDYEIHDFMRFKSNSSVTTNQSNYLGLQGYPAGTSGNEGKNAPFLDQPISSTNPEYNATGFRGGAHRMLIADYDFVEPGIYAEDANAYFDVDDNYPDLDGDGIGEGHAFVRVNSRDKMNDCSEGAGKIHIYSFFEKNSYTMNDWQELLASNAYGFPTQLLPDLNGTGSPGKIPDVQAEDNSTEGGRGSFYGFDDNKTDLTNFKMTTITIEYRVMDGWENKSEISTRMVYIYESRQFGDFAFYATPVTDASGAKFEQFYDNGSGDPFLRSNRKDLDGDGVSDFWEIALGTDREDPSDFPVMANEDTFKALTQGDFASDPVAELKSRLSTLHDATHLSGVSGLGDFNATQGL